MEIKTISKVLPYINKGKHNTWVSQKYPQSGLNYDFAVLFTDGKKGIFSSKSVTSKFNAGEKVKVTIKRPPKHGSSVDNIGSLSLETFSETFSNPNPKETYNAEKEIAFFSTIAAISIYMEVTEGELDFKDPENIASIKRIAIKIAPVLDDIAKSVEFELTKDK